MSEVKGWVENRDFKMYGMVYSKSGKIWRFEILERY
jgi:hypothetical protein